MPVRNMDERGGVRVSKKPKNLLAHSESEDCICCPDICQTCPECDGTGKSAGLAGVNEAAKRGECWLCNGRKVVAHRGGQMPRLIIHREIA